MRRDQVMQVAEAIYCLCATFVDSELFLTGSSDCMLRIWQMSRKDGSTRIKQTHILRAHSGGILCVAACRAWSVVISGSEDGTAAIWDLNRAVHVRSIRHGQLDVSGFSEVNKIHLVAVNESTVSHAVQLISSESLYF